MSPIIFNISVIYFFIQNKNKSPRNDDGPINPLHHHKNSVNGVEELQEESDYDVDSLEDEDEEIDDTYRVNTGNKYQIQVSENRDDPMSFL